jgi:hypothetical protein
VSHARSALRAPACGTTPLTRAARHCRTKLRSFAPSPLRRTPPASLAGAARHRGMDSVRPRRPCSWDRLCLRRSSALPTIVGLCLRRLPALPSRRPDSCLLSWLRSVHLPRPLPRFVPVSSSSRTRYIRQSSKVTLR